MSELALEMPDLQIAFANQLSEADTLFLRSALADAVELTALSKIDSDLNTFAPEAGLKRLAAQGLRGELVFPTPAILKTSPRLLTYYRLLLGYSQKSFYDKTSGLSAFKIMESKGRITEPASGILDELCHLLCEKAGYLVASLGTELLSSRLLEDLTLLTLGPQWRGSKNNQIGGKATRQLFELIKQIVQPGITAETSHQLTLFNAARRQVIIKFAADPDIVIQETIGSDTVRNLVAIEIKGGTDASNLYNRLGEAEKSHQKAKHAGYVECWTVVNVSSFDETIARHNTPTTGKFFVLNKILLTETDSHKEFRDLIVSSSGIV